MDAWEVRVDEESARAVELRGATSAGSRGTIARAPASMWKVDESWDGRADILLDRRVVAVQGVGKGVAV